MRGLSRWQNQWIGPLTPPLPQARSSSIRGSARGISKNFGATRALDGVDFDVDAGEIHALVGENGAGKSTLVRILGGVHRPDCGEIAVEGQARAVREPA